MFDYVLGAEQTRGAFALVEHDLAPILTTGAPPDFDALFAVMARYGLTMDMDSMPRLIAEHGLNAPLA